MSNQQKPLWKKLLPLFFILGFLLLLFFLFKMQSGSSNKHMHNNGITAQNNQPAVIAPTVTRQTLKAGEEEPANQSGVKHQQVSTKKVDVNNPPTSYQTDEGYMVEIDKNGKKIIKDGKGVIQNSVPNDFTKAEQSNSLDLSQANIKGQKPYTGKPISDKTPTPKELQIPLDSGIGQLTQYLSTKNKDLSTVFPLNGVSFEKGTANFTGTSKEHLAYLLKMLQNYPDVHLKFMGHVSNTGDVTADRALSGKRAYSIKKYLVDNGIDYERLRHERYGSEHPLAPVGSADAEAMNNRIVMMISKR